MRLWPRKRLGSGLRAVILAKTLPEAAGGPLRRLRSPRRLSGRVRRKGLTGATGLPDGIKDNVVSLSPTPCWETPVSAGNVLRWPRRPLTAPVALFVVQVGQSPASWGQAAARSDPGRRFGSTPASMDCLAALVVPTLDPQINLERLGMSDTSEMYPNTARNVGATQ